jgi:hypothetical protein
MVRFLGRAGIGQATLRPVNALCHKQFNAYAKDGFVYALAGQLADVSGDATSPPAAQWISRNRTALSEPSRSISTAPSIAVRSVAIRLRRWSTNMSSSWVIRSSTVPLVGVTPMASVVQPYEPCAVPAGVCLAAQLASDSRNRICQPCASAPSRLSVRVKRCHAHTNPPKVVTEPDSCNAVPSVCTVTDSAGSR